MLIGLVLPTADIVTIARTEIAMKSANSMVIVVETLSKVLEVTEKMDSKR